LKSGARLGGGLAALSACAESHGNCAYLHDLSKTFVHEPGERPRAHQAGKIAGTPNSAASAAEPDARDTQDAHMPRNAGSGSNELVQARRWHASDSNPRIPRSCSGTTRGAAESRHQRRFEL